jgi:hypothetical protein
MNGPQDITALLLTITKVEVHLAYFGTPQNTGNDTTPTVTPSESEKIDHWETLTIKSPFLVDLVALAKTGDFSMLGVTLLAAGKYTEIRLYISAASATLADGSTVPLTIPGKNNTVQVVRPFTIFAGQSTKITMDFDAQHSVIKAGDTYILKPVVARLLQEHSTPEK